MATITSEAEHIATAIARSQLGPDPEAWIGATDERNEGVWEWITGEPFTFTSWAEGEPNNSGNEDYAAMRSNGNWNDLPIMRNGLPDVRHGYFLEIECFGLGTFRGVELNEGDLILNWQGLGIPQRASDIRGPWMDIPAPTNPLRLAPTAPKQFFRLRHP